VVAHGLLVAKRIAVAVAGFQADLDLVGRVQTQDKIKCCQGQNQNESKPGEASPETVAIFFVGIILRHCSGSPVPAKPAQWKPGRILLVVAGASCSAALVDGLAGAP